MQTTEREYLILIRHGNGHLIGKEWFKAESDSEAKTKAIDWLEKYQHRTIVTEMKICAEHLPYMLTVINGAIEFNKKEE